MVMLTLGLRWHNVPVVLPLEHEVWKEVVRVDTWLKDQRGAEGRFTYRSANGHALHEQYFCADTAGEELGLPERFSLVG